MGRQLDSALKSPLRCADDTKQRATSTVATCRLVPGSPSNNERTMGAADAEEEEESYQPMAAESLVRDPGLILDPDEPLTGDFLRSLSKPHLAMARLEMTWGPAGQCGKMAKICHRRAALLARLSTKVVRRS